MVIMELIIAKVDLKKKKRKEIKQIKPDTIWANLSIYSFEVILQNTYIYNRLLAAFSDKGSCN